MLEKDNSIVNKVVNIVEEDNVIIKEDIIYLIDLIKNGDRNE